MKYSILLPVFGLLFVAGQAYVACTYITDTYSGIVPANTEVTAYGPFTVTNASGCLKANISSTIRAVGAGAAPELIIQRLVGSTWEKAGGGTGRNASALGPFGTYRVVHDNKSSVTRVYSGTTAYGR